MIEDVLDEEPKEVVLLRGGARYCKKYFLWVIGTRHYGYAKSKDTKASTVLSTRVWELGTTYKEEIEGAIDICVLQTKLASDEEVKKPSSEELATTKRLA